MFEFMHALLVVRGRVQPCINFKVEDYVIIDSLASTCQEERTLTVKYVA